ncbi:MAG: hypothetical protein M1826_001554 [Phylliscum demangeonii]|nr:MAG: hypothetical protein M1826_001554 [Phylliscum demangeonii]
MCQGQLSLFSCRHFQMTEITTLCKFSKNNQCCNRPRAAPGTALKGYLKRTCRKCAGLEPDVAVYVPAPGTAASQKSFDHDLTDMEPLDEFELEVAEFTATLR